MFNIPKPNLNILVPDLAGAVAQGFQIAERQALIQENKRKAVEAERLARGQLELDNNKLAHEQGKAALAARNIESQIQKRDFEMSAEEQAQAKSAFYQKRKEFMTAMAPVAGVSRALASGDMSPETKADLTAQYQAAYSRLRSSQKDLPETMDAGQFKQLAEKVTQGHFAATDEDDLAMDEASKILAEQTGLPQVRDLNVANALDFGDKLSQIRAQIRKDKTDTAAAVGRDAAGLTTGAKTDFQKELPKRESALKLVTSIRDSFDKDFLTVQGRASALITKGKSYLDYPIGSEQREFYKKRVQFVNNTADSFNSIRQIITGAAAPMQEIENLKENNLNPDMDPEAFDAELERLTQKWERELTTYYRLLDEGVDFSQMTPEDRLLRVQSEAATSQKSAAPGRSASSPAASSSAPTPDYKTTTPIDDPDDLDLGSMPGPEDIKGQMSDEEKERLRMLREKYKR